MKEKSKKWGGRQIPLFFISSFLLFPLNKTVSLPAPFHINITNLKTINTFHTIDNEKIPKRLHSINKILNKKK